MSQQRISAATEWKNRMAAAKAKIPNGVGQQTILAAVAKKKPDLNKLTNATRWRNAWFMKAADPEFCQAVEEVVAELN